MAGSTILDIAYGLDIRTTDDPYLKRAEECLQIIDKAGNPGSFLVDIIPACAHCFFPFHLASFLSLLLFLSEIRTRVDARRVI
jgi:hypothetical protein